jgi:hypothetical protein
MVCCLSDIVLLFLDRPHATHERFVLTSPQPPKLTLHVTFLRHTHTHTRTYSHTHALSHTTHEPQPPELSALSKLEALALSRHRFTGGIPQQWSTLTSLKVLDLDANRLTGVVPLWMLPRANTTYLNDVTAGNQAVTETEGGGDESGTSRALCVSDPLLRARVDTWNIAALTPLNKVSAVPLIV